MWFLQKKEIVKIEIDETVLFDLHHKKKTNFNHVHKNQI